MEVTDLAFSGFCPSPVMHPGSNRPPALGPGLVLWPPFPACLWSLCEPLGPIMPHHASLYWPARMASPGSQHRCPPQAAPRAPEHEHALPLMPTLTRCPCEHRFSCLSSQQPEEAMGPLSAPSAQARAWLQRSVKGCWSLKEGRSESSKVWHKGIRASFCGSSGPRIQGRSMHSAPRKDLELSCS